VRDEIRNLHELWFEGYQRLLREARARAAVSDLIGPDERRGHPRFRIGSQDVTTNHERPLALRDMSITGLAFESARGYFTDRQVTLSLANVFSAETEVLACDPLAPEAHGGPRYRVRCRFRDEEHGLQFLTLALELERIERT
jgi:hypothetical protein